MLKSNAQKLECVWKPRHDIGAEYLEAVGMQVVYIRLFYVNNIFTKHYLTFLHQQHIYQTLFDFFTSKTYFLRVPLIKVFRAFHILV